MTYSKEKKTYPTETVPEKDNTVHLLDKDFKTIVFKMLKELKKDVKRVRKIIYRTKWKYQ